MKRLLILVTHLLGAGHLTRAAALARAFATNGDQVTLVSGGMPVALAECNGVNVHQLPPVQIRGTAFTALLDEAGQPVTSARLETRRAALADILRTAQPDILVTELFPFGRRVLADEFLSVLRGARMMASPPLILASIRDILATPKKHERVDETEKRLVDFYDGVLVHGDPAFAPLELSYPVSEDLRAMLHYTGYLDEGGEEARTPPTRRGIIVSGGSSAASLPLFNAAIIAAARTGDREWRLLPGRGIPDDRVAALRRGAPAHVSIEPARADFRHLLASAELSISQAGYNTAIDLIRAGTRAIVIPFEGGGETEQRLRADCLQRTGLATVVPEETLTPAALADAVEKALAEPCPAPARIAVDGARRSVAIVEKLLQRDPAHPALVRPSVDFSDLDDAIAASRDAGREPVLWWRDDDAAVDGPELDRLLSLASSYDVPLSLAVVPTLAKASLARRVRDDPAVTILVHGFAHQNNATAGAKKAEFGPDRPLETLETDAAGGLATLRAHFAAQLLPVFVPPWNRVAPCLLPRLGRLGYTGLSTFRDRPARFAAPGLLQINTHLDPIDWHGSRSLVAIPALVSGLAGTIRSQAAGGTGEPTGLLTHHLVHDAPIWSFCDALLSYLARNGVAVAGAKKLFCDKMQNVVEP